MQDQVIAYDPICSERIQKGECTANPESEACLCLRGSCCRDNFVMKKFFPQHHIRQAPTLIFGTTLSVLTTGQ